MKSFFPFLALVCTTPLLAQTPGAQHKAKHNSTKKFVDVDKNDPTKQQAHAKGHKHSGSHTASQAAAMQHSSGSDMVMIIDPQMRAQDLKDALTFLQKTTGKQPVAVTLTDGQKISNIMSINVMPGGTMLVLKVSTVKGVKYHVVGIESVENIGHE